MPRIILVAMAAVLTTCAYGPERIDATSPTVTYRFSGDYEFEVASRKAADYCARYGRPSRLSM